MKVNVLMDLHKFESISETSGQKLIGGFSATFSVNELVDESGGSNNCQGGNCKTGCGTGQNIQCNTVDGCGGL
jgi:hypothetical protein